MTVQLKLQTAFADTNPNGGLNISLTAQGFKVVIRDTPEHRVAAAQIVRAVNANDELISALESIAMQRSVQEIDANGDRADSDFEGGYDAIVNIARAALAKAS